MPIQQLRLNSIGVRLLKIVTKRPVENIKDAIKLDIEDRVADGEEIPDHVTVSLSTVQVSV